MKLNHIRYCVFLLSLMALSSLADTEKSYITETEKQFVFDLLSPKKGTRTFLSSAETLRQNLLLTLQQYIDTERKRLVGLTDIKTLINFFVSLVSPNGEQLSDLRDAIKNAKELKAKGASSFVVLRAVSREIYRIKQVQTQNIHHDIHHGAQFFFNITPDQLGDFSPMNGDYVRFSPNLEIKKRFNLTLSDGHILIGKFMQFVDCDGTLCVVLKLAEWCDDWQYITKPHAIPLSLVNGFSFQVAIDSNVEVLPIVENSIRSGTYVEFETRNEQGYSVTEKGVVVSVNDTNNIFTIRVSEESEAESEASTKTKSSVIYQDIPILNIIRVLRSRNYHPAPSGTVYGASPRGNGINTIDLKNLAKLFEFAGSPLIGLKNKPLVRPDGTPILQAPGLVKFEFAQGKLKSLAAIQVNRDLNEAELREQEIYAFLVAWYEKGCPKFDQEGNETDQLLRPDLKAKGSRKKVLKLGSACEVHLLGQTPTGN
ncbi:MAG: hypothetical protein HY843_09040 [Bdellovibrio sp.]|nr:hypothetical protein [Bdellovibrio sp.]